MGRSTLWATRTCLSCEVLIPVTVPQVCTCSATPFPCCPTDCPPLNLKIHVHCIGILLTTEVMLGISKSIGFWCLLQFPICKLQRCWFEGMFAMMLHCFGNGSRCIHIAIGVELAWNLGGSWHCPCFLSVSVDYAQRTLHISRCWWHFFSQMWRGVVWRHTLLSHFFPGDLEMVVIAIRGTTCGEVIPYCKSSYSYFWMWFHSHPLFMHRCVGQLGP